MDAHVEHVMQECAKGSDDGRLTFPRVVTMLTEAGVEVYFADLRRAEKTFYMPDGESYIVPTQAIEAEPARAFSAASVATSIRQIQRGKSTYTEFCESIVRAGCVAYLVSLAGKRAVYFGRTGDIYVEPFSAAA